MVLASVLIASCLAYTNVAGKVIWAEPVRLDGDKVTFRKRVSNSTVQPSTSNLNLSLSLFPQSEQRRIKQALGIYEPPPELKGLWEEISAQRRRAEARAKAGKMTPEELEEYNRNLDAAWEHYSQNPPRPDGM